MNEAQTARREHELYKVTLVGSLVNLLLVAFKLLAGVVGHSAAMVADGVHSLSDLATDLIVLVFVRISGKPADKKHDYGHGKYETFATLLIGVAWLLVGVGILWSGGSEVYRFLQGETLESPGYVALCAALFSILSKELVFHYTQRAGVRYHSPAVIANAWHHRSDALSSIGTAIGIGGAILLGESGRVLDPIAAIVVSFFILNVAVKQLLPCLDELLESSLPEEVEAQILRLAEEVEGVSQPHKLRTRQIGSRYAIDLHIRMDGQLSLFKAHEKATEVERKLKETFGSETYINVHIEPVK